MAGPTTLTPHLLSAQQPLHFLPAQSNVTIYSTPIMRSFGLLALISAAVVGTSSGESRNTLRLIDFHLDELG